MSDAPEGFDTVQTVEDIDSLRDLEVQGHQILFYGKRNNGKTTAIQEAILPRYNNHLVYDTAQEYDSPYYSGEDPPARYIPSIRHGKNKKGREELNNALDTIVLGNPDKWDLVVTTEINRFTSARGDLPRSMMDLNDWCGDNHMDLGWIMDFRRPAQVHGDLKALAQFHVIFNLTASVDLEWIADEIHDDLDEDEFKDTVKNLDPGEYVILDSNGRYKKYDRLDLENHPEWYP